MLTWLVDSSFWLMWRLLLIFLVAMGLLALFLFFSDGDGGSSFPPDNGAY